MSMRALLLAVALVGALTACPGSAPPPSGTRPPDPRETPPTTHDPGAVQDVDPMPPIPPPDEFKKADGVACSTGDDCASGVCEGQGCGDGQQGRCMPRNRACTRDLVLYCGCDGKPFQASGSCPGRRFANPGRCQAGPPPATRKPDGAACLIGAECGSGICEGQGCGAGRPGTCMPRSRACTKDLQMYCGCDGKTFQASGSCPGRRYAQEGACSGPPIPPPPGKRPDGAACLLGGDCVSGICEGQGCGSDAPGKCMPRSRACTKDLRTYCGCDGKTFQASGSCPGRRYANPNQCTATQPPPTKKPDGLACLAGDECMSGVCEGEGCGAGAPGKCMPRARACTRDLRSYCGCDGKTFRASGSCPGRRFASRTKCEGS